MAVSGDCFKNSREAVIIHPYDRVDTLAWCDAHDRPFSTCEMAMALSHIINHCEQVQISPKAGCITIRMAREIAGRAK